MSEIKGLERQVSKGGNSLHITLPRDVVRLMSIKNGQFLIIDANKRKGQITIKLLEGNYND